jgi:NADH-quinone oxidoreductase subunit N
MYFDEPTESFQRPVGGEMTAILTGTALFVALFVVFVSPVVDSAGAVAAALVIQ